MDRKPQGSVAHLGLKCKKKSKLQNKHRILVNKFINKKHSTYVVDSIFNGNWSLDNIERTVTKNVQYSFWWDQFILFHRNVNKKCKFFVQTLIVHSFMRIYTVHQKKKLLHVRAFTNMIYWMDYDSVTVHLTFGVNILALLINNSI